MKNKKYKYDRLFHLFSVVKCLKKLQSFNITFMKLSMVQSVKKWEKISNIFSLPNCLRKELKQSFYWKLCLFKFMLKKDLGVFFILKLYQTLKISRQTLNFHHYLDFLVNFILGY